MKRFSEQLNKKAESINLRAAEKQELRERLVSYMEYHPLPSHLKTAAPKKAAPEKLFTDAFATFTLPFSLIFKSSAAAAILLLVVIPFAAEQAVPGDTLYSIKVQFNEEVRGTLTFDSYQKVEWETERLNRRIAEAQLLASEGRLTEEVEAEVAAAVKAHTENAQKEIAILREQDADEATIASIALDTTLEVQSNSLKSSQAPQADSSSQVLLMTGSASYPTGLIARVIDQSRTDSEIINASSTLPSYDKLMARVEQNTTRVYELMDSLKSTTESTELVDVTRRIQDIERSVTEVLEHQQSDEEEDRKELVAILQRTQKLIVFMTELQITQTVDIESLVPVVLTDEEEVTFRLTYTTELDGMLVRISKGSTTIADVEVLEKIDFAVAKITELKADMDAAETFLAFVADAKEAQALAVDALVLVEQFATPNPAEDTASSTDTAVDIELVATTTLDVVDATSSVPRASTSARVPRLEI